MFLYQLDLLDPKPLAKKFDLTSKPTTFNFWKYSLDPEPKGLQFEKQNPQPQPNKSCKNQEAVHNGMYSLNCVSTSTTIPHSSNLGVIIYHPELDQINFKRHLINCKMALSTFISMLFGYYTCGQTHFRKIWGFHNFNHLGLLIKTLRSQLRHPHCKIVWLVWRLETWLKKTSMKSSKSLPLHHHWITFTWKSRSQADFFIKKNLH